MKIKYLIFIMLSAFVFTGCDKEVKYVYNHKNNNNGSSVDKHYTETINVEEKYLWIDLNKGNTQNISASITSNIQTLRQYTAKVNNVNFKRTLDDSLLYESKYPDIIDVDANGVLTAKKEGVSIIKIYTKNGTAKPKYVIANSKTKKSTNFSAKVVMLSGSNIVNIYKEKTDKFQIESFVYPLHATDNSVSYISVDDNIASVDESGMVTGNSEGEAEIFVYANSDPEVYSSKKVFVYNKKPINGNVHVIPDGLSKIEIKDEDPLSALSLIGGYYVVNHTIDDGETIVPSNDSQLRVNADLSDMNNGIVNILLYIKLDGKEVSLKIPRELGAELDIKGIFESLGAKITGDYTLSFTLSPKDYERVADFGLVAKGKTLKLNLQKFRELEPMATDNPMGDDVKFDPNAEPSKGNVDPINFPEDPFSLIAKYEIVGYTNEGESGNILNPDAGSEFRVNATMEGSKLGIKILMYLKLNGRIYSFYKDKELAGSDLNQIIESIFNSLGANVTGDYTLDFVLNSSNYPELVKANYMKNGETLVIKLKKVASLEPLNGLGDIEPDNWEDFGDTEVPDYEIPEAEDFKPVVEKIFLNHYFYTPTVKNEKVKLNATIKPESLANEKLTWESSDDSIATVDENGNVTILQNKNATITVKSKNNVSAEMKIEPLEKPIDFKLNKDVFELIMGITPEEYLSFTVFPDIFDIDKIEFEVKSDNESVVVYDKNEKMLKAVDSGTAKIIVSANGISRESLVHVLDKPSQVINVTDLILPKEKGVFSLSTGFVRLNASVLPAHATNKKIDYIHSCNNIDIEKSTGVVKFKNVGKCEIKVVANGNPEKFKMYNLVIDKFPTDIKFKKREFSLLNGETMNIEPIFEGDYTNTNYEVKSSNPDVIEITESKQLLAKKVGSSDIILNTEDGKEKFFTVHVYTPANMQDKNSLIGTYEIVDVEQWNGKLDVSTTNKFGHNIERMIGEITIDFNGNKVIMYNKIQMDSNAMNTFPGVAGFGVTEARQGQFNTFKFNEYEYNPNGFGGTGSKLDGKVSADRDGMLLISQLWKEGALGITVDVNVRTWIRKKSNTVKNINNRQLFWNYSNSNYNKKANAYEHFGNLTPANPEPHYQEGLSRK